MAASFVIERSDFDALLGALQHRGHTIIGPTIRDGAIIYDEVACAAQLPAGWTDEQAVGRYRLRGRKGAAVFGSAVGPHSFKQFQLPSEVKLWEADVDQHGGLSDPVEPERKSPRYPFLGAGPCALHAP